MEVLKHRDCRQVAARQPAKVALPNAQGVLVPPKLTPPTLPHACGALGLLFHPWQVVGAVTSALNAKEEAKRMKPMPGMVGGMSGSILRGTATVADSVVGGTVGEQTPKRLGKCGTSQSPIQHPLLLLVTRPPHPLLWLILLPRLLCGAGSAVKGMQSMLLGGLPQEALTGSFQEEKRAASATKSRRFSRLRFWKRDASAPVEAEHVVVQEEVVRDAAAEVEARMHEALSGGGMAVDMPSDLRDDKAAVTA